MRKQEKKLEDKYLEWLDEYYGDEVVGFKLIMQAGRGFPDLTVMGRGKVLFLELKSPTGKGKVGPLQKIVIKVLKKIGMVVIVSNDLNDLKHKTIMYFGEDI